MHGIPWPNPGCHFCQFRISWESRGIAQMCEKSTFMNETFDKMWNIAISLNSYLCDFEKFRDPVHSNEKLLVLVQGVFTILLVHVEVFFCNRDDSFSFSVWCHHFPSTLNKTHNVKKVHMIQMSKFYAVVTKLVQSLIGCQCNLIS